MSAAASRVTSQDEAVAPRASVSSSPASQTPSPPLLAGKTAIVTGSTAGIGKAIAKLFLQQGASVVVNGRSKSGVDAAVADLLSSTGVPADRVFGVPADLSTTEGIKSFTDGVATIGRFIDILVNNMGVYGRSDFFTSTDDEWVDYFRTNVVSSVALSRHYLKPMLEANTGRIIIVSSAVGVVPLDSMLPYAVSKGAQVTLARGLAELTRGTNVTVNSLLPGATLTDGVNTMLDEIISAGGAASREEASGTLLKTIAPHQLLTRLLTAEEVAKPALFLASDLSAGVNGSAQRVEGGFIRHI